MDLLVGYNYSRASRVLNSIFCLITNTFFMCNNYFNKIMKNNLYIYTILSLKTKRIQLITLLPL